MNTHEYVLVISFMILLVGLVYLRCDLCNGGTFIQFMSRLLMFNIHISFICMILISLSATIVHRWVSIFMITLYIMYIIWSKIIKKNNQY